MTGPEATVVRWEPWNEAPRRLVFEPAVDGYYLIDEVYGGDGWRERGRTLVERPTIENADALR